MLLARGVLTRASILYYISVWIQEPRSRIQDPKDSVDSVDLYKSVRGRIGLYKEALTLVYYSR
jgi:HAMP domain-containing protein